MYFDIKMNKNVILSLTGGLRGVSLVEPNTVVYNKRISYTKTNYQE